MARRRGRKQELTRAEFEAREEFATFIVMFLSVTAALILIIIDPNLAFISLVFGVAYGLVHFVNRWRKSRNRDRKDEAVREQRALAARGLTPEGQPIEEQPQQQRRRRRKRR